MVRLKPWQWLVLATPIASIIIFFLIAAGTQIHQWEINWIWGVFIFVFGGWRWLLAKWTKTEIAQIEATIDEITHELESSDNQIELLPGDEAGKQVETALQNILQTSQSDPIIWEDWQTFWGRCQELVVEVAHAYHPEVKRPLLNIYIPQAYGLIRGTVDDMDRWISKLSPALNQVTIGQAYEAYEVYQKLEPSARKLFKVWNWAQWVINPAVAIAKTTSQSYTSKANQQLLANLNQLFREAALRNLCRQAIALYSGNTLPPSFTTTTATLPQAKTQTLRDIITQAESTEEVEQKPVNILLVGRTGAGKSSLINTLFRQDLAEVDVLPSTDRIQSYHYSTAGEEKLNLWDTPGYEQVNREDLRELVLDYAAKADLLLLVTPALDPALQMDVDFLKDIRIEVEDLPTIAIVTQVDRLRPIREWNPPYDWQNGETPKEKSIREATKYRAEFLGDYCSLILPLVTEDKQKDRNAWGIESLSMALLDNITGAKQYRIARFLRDREARILTAAKIIDRYTFQMTTTQGVTALLKSPVLQFLSTMTTGNTALAYALAQQIPVEQLPVVIGKLQMAYDLFMLLSKDPNLLNFDLLSLWSLLLNNDTPPDRNAWAFGNTLVEYWTQNLAEKQLEKRFEYYLRHGLLLN
ncbi:MAG: GTPase family protein [Xenococcaceae cyanobacterium MO_188.B32]|nr:GTPase family protein [Xenococcaceae cyanobacterium MO_188.B32]